METHGDRLERDLLLYYGVDLIDVLDGAHSPRKIWNLITRLPEDSHTRSVETWGEKFEGWSQDRLMSGLLLEQTLFSRHDFAQANSEKKLAPPKELDLPGRKSQVKSNPFSRMLADAKAHEARS